MGDHVEDNQYHDVLPLLQWFFALLQRARRATCANIRQVYQHYEYIWHLRLAASLLCRPI